MGECKSDGCCTSSKQDCCKSGSCSEGSHDMSKMMMNLANEAWTELMKEKMKKEFEKHNGEKMNKIAEASVQGCNAMWQGKMQAKAGCKEFSENLMKAFMG